jgi:hypothetical protein
VRFDFIYKRGRKITYNVTVRLIRDIIIVVTKIITYSECVCVCVCVDLGIKHAMRMRHIILSSVACPAVQYFSSLSHKMHDFRGKKLLHIKSVFRFSLQLLFETFLFL